MPADWVDAGKSLFRRTLNTLKLEDSGVAMKAPGRGKRNAEDEATATAGIEGGSSKFISGHPRAEPPGTNSIASIALFCERARNVHPFLPLSVSIRGWLAG